MDRELEGASELIPRRVDAVVAESLSAFRVVVVHGARQVGKTTLARALVRRFGAVYVSLDEEDQRRAAREDPRGFLEGIGTPLAIDEIQRVGEPLVLAIKVAVDSDTGPGRYLLTASTNFLTVPTISESLAGRVDIVTLWPLSMGELTGGSDGFVDRAFAGPEALATHPGATLTRREYLEAVCRGGFPSVQAMTERSRRRWFVRHVETVVQREVVAAADVRRADGLTAMVRLLAANTGGEFVASRVADRLNLDRGTVNSYAPWLETVFLVHRSPAWRRNLTARLVQRHKLYLADTGVAAALVGKDADALARPAEPATGALIETFAVNEITKQLGWSDTWARLHHLRDSDGAEIDVVLETPDGRVVGVEVKASTTPRPEDFRWLAMLRDRLDPLGDQFVCGVVLHTGPNRVTFGDRMIALPLADLWT
ncbi:MAG: ATP-binding protein [Acidimicrobiia bacterium]